MPRVPRYRDDEIQVTAGPHSHREGWHVVRLNYRYTPEQARRVAAAITLLRGPVREPDVAAGEPPAAADERRSHVGV